MQRRALSESGGILPSVLTQLCLAAFPCWGAPRRRDIPTLQAAKREERRAAGVADDISPGGTKAHPAWWSWHMLIMPDSTSFWLTYTR